ncbi:Inner membrane amino-acid ABC transporter permease protein YecS [Hartmannibacter diazotrophicus]|uniref:Inner membrane amino-acid ABC transporter permease protein YecS n=1 Tax=Hartmannibacter diazotrophicus TaxID=1482074 RepID=A0A2C9D029_9HYPH|nr:amino acid ABC transporter permease [Hartmannibacter diazotrophicus]SON53747.1 Inner membrane amino-acid ABC transporter permease protein YecS [Hartmannibacter diazotrophicus]
MSFNVDLVVSFLPTILSALGVTFLLWVAGSGLGLIVGFLVAVARRYGPRPVNYLLMLPVEVIRGTPSLVQIFLLYYGGPYIGLSLDKVTAGIVALTIYGAAYYSELWRTGFEAIPKGHVEAADCVGLSKTQTMRRIILPEMTMLILPSMVNMTILMLKETAILSIISVPELTLAVSAIGTQYYAFVESFTILALLYWALVEACSAAGRYAEARLSKYRFSAS